MAFPTAVNSQITDSATQANVEVLAVAPSVAMGNLYQATAQALANAAHNASSAQQQANVIMQASTTMGVATLYSIDTASACGMIPHQIENDEHCSRSSCCRSSSPCRSLPTKGVRLSQE